MSDKTYVVYQHRNIINNKVYIGITCRRPSGRYGHNGKKYAECPHFWNAIQKYGWENFEHTILYSGLSYEEACEKEIQTITEKKSTDPMYGYNISPGGHGGDSELMKQKWLDDEFRSDMKSRMREAWKDPDKRKRRSNAAKERWANPEFKSEVMKKVIQSCAKAVRCIETGEIFPMLKLASQKYNTHSGNIVYACKHNSRCCGLHWEYVI